ncbi:MAG: hypothetical protein JSS60_05180 [Verrucomicrobia bacterium]|nr:hypothetical protein [Verrucomicrobiota bacterium]
MSVLSKDYISNLPYTSSSQLKPVHSDSFFEALHAEYGEDKTKATVGWLFSQSDKTFHGIKSFQDRFLEAIGTNGLISPDDQKYVADLVHRVSTGRLKTKMH